MNRKNLLLSFAVLSGLCALPLAAQTLTSSPDVPAADGIVETGEYTWKTEQKDAALSLSLSADGTTIYAALEAPETGWAAVGLGTRGMNGAFMVLGSDDGGKTEISEQTGKGFSHKPNAEKILQSEAVKENGGKTVLEFSVPAAKFIKNGKLDVIAAWSKKDSFSSKHTKHISLSVPVQTK
ncbi:MAG TPA: hypothetical protein DCL73_05985 [Treponema sp.]|nr:hypothetical protein [Treponema sp.]